MLEKLPLFDSSYLSNQIPKKEDVADLIRIKSSQGYKIIHDNQFYRENGTSSTIRISRDLQAGTMFRLYPKDSAIYPQETYYFDNNNLCRYQESSAVNIFNQTGPEIKSIRLIFGEKGNIIENWRYNKNIATNVTIIEKRIYSGNKKGYLFQILENNRVLNEISNQDPNYQYEY